MSRCCARRTSSTTTSSRFLNADGTGGANGTRGNGRDGATRPAQVILLAAADPANAYGAPCRGLRSRTRRRAATGPAGRRERWSSWPTAS
jgi:hypothetical protein